MRWPMGSGLKHHVQSDTDDAPHCRLSGIHYLVSPLAGCGPMWREYMTRHGHLVQWSALTRPDSWHSLIVLLVFAAQEFQMLIDLPTKFINLPRILTRLHIWINTCNNPPFLAPLCPWSGSGCGTGPYSNKTVVKTELSLVYCGNFKRNVLGQDDDDD